MAEITITINAPICNPSETPGARQARPRPDACLPGIEPIDLFTARMAVGEVVPAGVVDGELRQRLHDAAMRAALTP